MATALRRFYATADGTATSAGFEIRLDGRPVRTPLGAGLVAPTAALAGLIVEEWLAQGERIEPHTMPLTRILNTAIDRVQGRRQAIIGELAGFAPTDLVLFRAEAPEELLQRERAHWDPVLAWLHARHGVALRTAQGLSPPTQSAAALAGIARLVGEHDAWRLTCLHMATTLAGSLALGLALIADALTAEAFWAAAMVDEIWQAERWGVDFEAKRRNDALRREVDEIVAFRDAARD